MSPRKIVIVSLLYATNRHSLSQISAIISIVIFGELLSLNKVSWIIFSAIVVLILGGLIAFSRANSNTVDVSSVDANAISQPSEQNGQIGDRVYNDTVSDVVLVEYGDFQCPGCAAAHPNIKTLLEEYGDRISFVFRNFPLTSIHPNARAASAAAEAAGQQDKYWEMHDLLYENQADWQSADPAQRTATFKGYAESIGIDVAQLEADLASSAVNQKISFDQALGGKVGVDSTPTFFLGGEELPQEVSQGILSGDLTGLESLLDEALAE